MSQNQTIKFRKRPIVIEAFRIGIDPIPMWAQNAEHFQIHHKEGVTYAEITTLEGVMRGGYGDYVIKGAIGELYPCRADVFHETYDLEAPEEDHTIFKKIVQKIYRHMDNNEQDKLLSVLNRIHAWGKIKSDPEMSLDEIQYVSNLVLEKIINDG